MPEGPEIRLAADRIAKVLVNSEIVEAQLNLPRLQPFRPRLIGTNVTAVDTRGKSMLTRFDNGLTLYSHNQLYGRWYVTPRDRTPSTRRSLRVALHTDRHSAWLYSATDIEVLTGKQLGEHPFLCKLGPDVLDPSLRPTDICNRLEQPKFQRRSVAALYLDQAFLAGIGNYLRAEILFTAGVHPAVRPQDMNRAGRMRLARATLTVSRRAYALRGVTVTRALAASLKRAGQRYGKYRHWVFARGGEACRQCGTDIERHAYAGRSLFWCPGCQPD
ncbi:MAG: endonuclease VIII [Gammaproteobacteria bacterium]